MYYKNFKRFFDTLSSFLAMIILLPILFPIMIILLSTGENYIFYFQERIGLKNKKFSIWKFATMLKDSPNIGTGLHTTTNDPRILPIGGFLRKTKINELPQLINVFLGDMSVVGPRPLVDKTFDYYPEHIKAKIYNVKPGLTGIGSIVFRDEEEILSKTKLPLEEYSKKYISPYKGKLELWYQNNQSFFVDFMIIIFTVWVILFPKSDIHYKVFKTLPKRDFWFYW